MSDAQDLPQARCNVTSMVRTTRSKAHGSLRRGVPTRRTVLRSEKSSIYIYERARRGVLSSKAFRPKGKRKAGNVGRRSDLRNRANEGCQRLENRRISG